MRTIPGDITATLGEALSRRIGKERYGLWFETKTKLCAEQGRLRIGVPNHFYQEWLENTFGADVRAVAQEILGPGVEIAFVVDPELFRAARQLEARQCEAQPDLLGAVQEPPPPKQVAPSARGAAGAACRNHVPPPLPRTRRFRRLDEFVVGPCNRVAHAAAVSLVEAPEQIPSPLILHGPVGVGKTHLLEGIYAGLRRSRPEWRVWFLAAEDFTNRFVHAIHGGKLTALRKQLRECDALLVDDLHFLAKKPATQEEFLHTFDVLHAEERPVIATCDAHPRLAEQFMPELGDRLIGGSVWALATPERATRLDLLRRKAGQDREPIAADALEFLAEQLRGNVRELEGALHTVRHFARTHGRHIDLDLVREALTDVLRHSVRHLRLGDVESAVCRALGLEAGALQSKRRSWTVSHPRMLAMYLARKHTSATHTEIGQRFGGRNHSTAVAGEKRIRAWIEANETMQLGRQTVPVREVLERIEHELLK